MGSIPGSGRYPGEGNGNSLQYSCQENPMDRGAWQATVQGVARVGHDLTTKSPYTHTHTQRERERLMCAVMRAWSPSPVRLFATPWTAAHQASLSITNFQSLLKLMSIESVIPSNPLNPLSFSSCLQSFPASGSFPVSQFFASAGQRIGVSASASVLPMNIQDQFPLGLTGLISLKFKGLSRV